VPVLVGKGSTASSILLLIKWLLNTKNYTVFGTGAGHFKPTILLV